MGISSPIPRLHSTVVPFPDLRWGLGMRPGYLQMLLLTGPGLSLICCYPHEPLGNSFQMWIEWTVTPSNESSYLHTSPPSSPPTKQRQTVVMSKPSSHQWNTCPWKWNHKTATKQGRNNTTILLCQAYSSFRNSSSQLTTTPLLTKSNQSWFQASTAICAGVGLESGTETGTVLSFYTRQSTLAHVPNMTPSPLKKGLGCAMHSLCSLGIKTVYPTTHHKTTRQ